MDGLDELGGFCLATSAALWLSTLLEWKVHAGTWSFEESTWCVLSFRCSAFELLSMLSDVAAVICDCLQ
eukprot:SAG31_NODE_7317_length_1720_cov_5.928439_1_plen_69_part_00